MIIIALIISLKFNAKQAYKHRWAVKHFRSVMHIIPYTYNLYTVWKSWIFLHYSLLFCFSVIYHHKDSSTCRRGITRRFVGWYREENGGCFMLDRYWCNPRVKEVKWGVGGCFRIPHTFTMWTPLSIQVSLSYLVPIHTYIILRNILVSFFHNHLLSQERKTFARAYHEN